MTAIRPTLPPLAAGAACLVLGGLFPLASPLLLALGAGALATNLPLVGPDAREGQARAGRWLLRLGIVLVGLRLPLADVVAIGLPGLLVVGTTVATTFAVTCALGDRWGLDRGLVTLIAAGFSVCGAAAVAAVEGAVRRRDEDAALAVAMVTLFGTAMVVVEPLLAAHLGLSDRQLGIWAGASIHEVAQVVAAASFAGAGAVAVATTVKLGRVATLAATYVAARARSGGSPQPAGTATPSVPWFVHGFLAAIALRATGVLPDAALAPLEDLSTWLLAAGMFGLGLGLRFATLWPVPPLVLLLCTASTATAAGVSLVIVVTCF